MIQLPLATYLLQNFPHLDFASGTLDPELDRYQNLSGWSRSHSPPLCKILSTSVDNLPTYATKCQFTVSRRGKKIRENGPALPPLDRY